MATAASSLVTTATTASGRNFLSSTLHTRQPPRSFAFRSSSSLAAQPATTPPRPSSPADVVASILSKVQGTDAGVLLSSEGHKEVSDLALELSKHCVAEPVKSPLIFGEWDVAYCSVPTSPGGGYRNAVGRVIFRTKEMVQVVEAPDSVRNKVGFSLFGFLDGEVSLNGKLRAVDDKWIEVVFEPPELRIGTFGFKYGGKSEVKLEILYVDDKLRLGKGSRGSLFVFSRIAPSDG